MTELRLNADGSLDELVSDTCVKPMTQHLHDWRKLIDDIEAAGLSNWKLAMRLGVDPSTLRNWKSGGEPKHRHGVNLVEIWCEVTASPPARSIT